ncbi:MAG: ShlB/FhaC/HecB family hemolysin secretion/activation protein [Sporomusaceae bacterium]|nr:ShlB/FhaC/HecB family hemolysin secretion/activation protein [Sporomusaceae bacterium]
MKPNRNHTWAVNLHRLAAALLLAAVVSGHSVAAPATIPPGAQDQVHQSLRVIDELSGYYRVEGKPTPPADSQDPVVTDQTQTEALPADDELRVYIRQIAVDASEILTPAEIAAVTAGYEEREVSIRELQTVAEQLNALYRTKNYITAKALLPPQTIVDGIVRIQLVEGRLGQLHFSGNNHTRDYYFTNRLQLQSGGLIHLTDLERQLTGFNLANDIRVRAELKPGAAFGTTDIVLVVQEPVNEQLSFFSDNAGSKTTGRYRYGLSYFNRSLTGNRDSLSLTPVWSKGSFSGSAFYNVAMTNGGRVGISYDRSRIDIISGQFAHLNIEGYSNDLALHFTWPMAVRPGFRSEQSLQLHLKNSETLFDGSKILNTDTNTLAWELSFQTGAERRATLVKHGIVRGYTDDGSGNQQFVKYTLSVVRQQAFVSGTMQTLRLNGQLTADRSLPTVEQFSLGGMSSVRGYPGGVGNGDKGYLISAEWTRPLSEQVMGLLFIDHGGAIPYKGAGLGETSDDFLTSVGVGLTTKFDDSNSAKLVLGFPLQHRDEYSPRLHFVWQASLL